MKILALEFSSAQRSVALIDSAPGNSRVLGAAGMTGGRHTQTFALIERVLTTANVAREAVDCLAVGLGPGSYTGIRIAISTAQGWQLASGIKLVGVSGVDCLAARAHAAGWRGRVHLAIDAQRNEFYLATCELGEKEWRVVEPLRLVSPEAVRELLGRGELVAGPDLETVLPGAKPLYPDAETLGLLAARRDNFVSGEKLEPIYLREISFVKAPAPRIDPPPV